MVEPRLALGALRAHLAAQDPPGRYRFHAGRRVVAAEPHALVDTTGTRWEGDVVVLATGAAYDHLAATQPLASRLRRVRLQMLETAPFAPSLTTSLADADTLRYYPAYEVVPLVPLGDQKPVAAVHHLQLLLVQRPDGGLTIGDTHAYGEPFDFALREDPSARAPGPGAPDPRCGHPAGAAPLGGRVRPVHRRRGVPARGDPPGRVAGHRTGRTRHDLCTGDRGGHARSGRGGRMIGPYALACLDMAGTTVRDDGAVEAAFATALATVGIAEGSPRYDEAQVFVRDTMGWSKADVFAALLAPAEARRATAAFAAAYEAIVATGAVAEVPGALEVLRGLRDRGVQVCLTTGFAPSTRDALLDALGWRDEVDLALSPDDVGRGRPAPDMILGAMARLGVDDPGAVAVAGDTVSDLEAGTAAGARAVVGVLSGAHDEAALSGAPHTAIIPDVTGLLQVLEYERHPADQAVSTKNETCSIIGRRRPGA